MDPSKLTRDKAAVMSSLKVMPNDSLVTKTGCFIHIPSKYVDKQLAVLSKQGTYILGIFALITPDGKYTVFNFPNMTRILPSETKRFFYDNIEYVEFEFAPGAPALMDVNVLVQDTLIYHIYDYFVDGGTIPWFMAYSDVISIFDLVPEYIGTKLGASWTVIKTILGQIARQPKDRTKMARELYTDLGKIKSFTPAYISFSSVLYGTGSTTAKLMGPYFDTAKISAINHPSEKSDNIEKYLRV